MLLQQIVEKLDAELDRLGRVREIVAGLARGPVLDLAEAEAELGTPLARVVEQNETEKSVTPRRWGRRSTRRGPQGPRRRAVEEKMPTALTSSIPAGPVVVMPSMQQARKEQKPEEERRPAKEGTLGAMIRALQQQGAL